MFDVAADVHGGRRRSDVERHVAGLDPETHVHSVESEPRRRDREVDERRVAAHGDVVIRHLVYESR